MKKLSSFKEKFFSIPTEFRRYYPQVDSCQQLDQSLVKKRGRPKSEKVVEGELADNIPVQKVLGRKKTPVPLSVSNSNSLLKYFGPKVAAATACPSRSLQNASGIQHVISELTSDACEVVMSISSPQPDVRHHSDIAVIEDAANLYGLKLFNCSCSFDTVLTVMVYFYFSLAYWKRERFQSSLPFLWVDFSIIDLSSPQSLEESKQKMMKFFTKYEGGKFYALESVYGDITSAVVGGDDMLNTHYEITKMCLTPECVGSRNSTSDEVKARQLGFFESCHSNDNLPEAISVTELIGNLWARRVHNCRHCFLPLDIQRNFIGDPELIAVSIAGAQTIIEEIIVVLDVQYSVFAVGYRGHLHFIAFIKHDGQVFEYDGQNQIGLLRPVVSDGQCFKNTITDSRQRIMKAQLVWYSKVIERGA
jgi:hypothetical protein